MKQYSYYYRRTDGFVLPYALLLTLIITLLLFSYLSLVSFIDKQTMRQIKKRKLDLNCQSAMQVILSDPESYSDSTSLFIENSVIEIRQLGNGLLNQFILTSKNQYDSSRVEYLLGSSIPEFGNNALIVTRPNLRLTVAGETKIRGNILATSDNLTKGNIFGIRNSSSSFLEGEIVVNENLQPKLFTDSLVSDLFNPGSEFQNFKMLSINNEFIRALDDFDVINITVENECRIQSNTVSTAVINLFSKEDVIIENDASFKNLNIYTEGKITVGANCSFQNVQFFSRDSISISNSIFNYPSIICLQVKTSGDQLFDECIQINSSIINGSIILISDVVGLSSNKSRIIIG
jgi:hypothetical protein